MTVIEKPEQRWYSVEEGLPELAAYVQVSLRDGRVSFAKRDIFYWRAIVYLGTEIVLKAVPYEGITHWRPRAKPPNETTDTIWIRTEDKQPTNGQLVFLCDGLQGELPRLCEWQAFKRDWYRYWMPVPDLPKSLVRVKSLARFQPAW